MTSIPQQAFPSLYTPQQSGVICEGRAGVDNMKPFTFFRNQVIYYNIVMYWFYIVVYLIRFSEKSLSVEIGHNMI